VLRRGTTVPIHRLFPAGLIPTAPSLLLLRMRITRRFDSVRFGFFPPPPPPP
jgi:hypothetical protein